MALLQPPFTTAMPIKFEDMSPTQPLSDYVFNDAEDFAGHELYLGAANTLGSQGLNSPHKKYDMPYFQNYTATNVYPSPERDEEPSPGDFLHHSHTEHLVTPSRPESLSLSQQPQQQLTDTESTGKTPSPKAPVKRKRENRYKNAPPSVLSRRRAQNRASQRAYRERKDQRIKDLELMLNQARVRNEELAKTCSYLRSQLPHFVPAATLLQHQQDQDQDQQLQQQQQQQLLLQQHRMSTSSQTSTVATPSTIPSSTISTPLTGSYDHQASTVSTPLMEHQPDMDSMFLYNVQLGASYGV